MSGAFKAVGNLVGGLFGSDSGQGAQQSTSSAGVDPAIRNAFLNNVNRATSVANNLGVRQFAPRTMDYNVGQAAIRNTADTTNLGFRAMDSGIGLTAANAGTRSVDGINAYMNPYLNIVAGNTLADLNRANAMALNNVRGDAIARRAFGGSRQGIAEAETNRNFADITARTLGDLYSSGFNTALGASQNDLNRNLSAASQLSTLGNNRLAAGYTAGQNVMNLGLADQDFTQEQLDAARNLGVEQQQIINTAMGLNPLGGASTSSSTSSTRGKGLLGFL